MRTISNYSAECEPNCFTINKPPVSVNAGLRPHVAAASLWRLAVDQSLSFSMPLTVNGTNMDPISILMSICCYFLLSAQQGVAFSLFFCALTVLFFNVDFALLVLFCSLSSKTISFHLLLPHFFVLFASFRSCLSD